MHNIKQTSFKISCQSYHHILHRVLVNEALETESCKHEFHIRRARNVTSNSRLSIQCVMACFGFWFYKFVFFISLMCRYSCNYYSLNTKIGRHKEDIFFVMYFSSCFKNRSTIYLKMAIVWVVSPPSLVEAY